MGVYAEDELRRQMRRGISHRRASPPKKRKRIPCPDCSKMCAGQGGLMEHQRVKHNYKWTAAECLRAPNEYEQEGKE